MKRSAIGDAMHSRLLTVNDIEYLVVGYPNTPEREVWRLGDETPAGLIFKENAACWVTAVGGKCWRSIEQAAVEVAKADQGVTFAR
jgi:hypothetical protein